MSFHNDARDVYHSRKKRYVHWEKKYVKNKNVGAH